MPNEVGERLIYVEFAANFLEEYYFMSGLLDGTFPGLRDKEKIRQFSQRVVDAQRPIRIREAVKWDDQIEAQVVASKFKQLPDVKPEYYAEKIGDG